MKITELREFLKTLAVAKLRSICNIPRCWGVYQSSPAISGYSKCKKDELCELIYNHYNSQEGFDWNLNAEIIYRTNEYIYQDDYIKVQLINEELKPKFIFCDICKNFHERFGEHKKGE